MAKTRTRPSRPREGDPAATPVELIVRRGALRRFDRLKQTTAKLPVKLVWDRRVDERRTTSSTTSGERRKTDRRQDPPYTWDAGDFVVVDPRRRPSSKKTRS